MREMGLGKYSGNVKAIPEVLVFKNYFQLKHLTTSKVGFQVDVIVFFFSIKTAISYDIIKATRKMSDIICAQEIFMKRL